MSCRRPSNPRPARATVARTVVWVSIAFAMLALSTPLRADGHKARLSRGLAEKIGAGQSRSVIVAGTSEQVRDLAVRHGLTVEKVLGSGGVLRVDDAAALLRLTSDPSVQSVADDALVSAHMATEVTALGADQAWAGLLGLAGVTGEGVGIAIIDSGMAAFHEALRGRVVASVDFVQPRLRGLDGYGHGTHVAAIAAGSVTTGAGRFSGVAPGAHVVNLRVLDASGRGTTSDVIAAIEWAMANKDAYGLRVINLSLGRPVLESWVDDPLVQAVERASRAGLVVVASAGNWGTLPDGTRVRDGITSPGNAPSAITVGAVDTMGTAARSDDRVTDWSSRGLTAIDGFLKPDLAAPGRRIVSAGAQNSTLAGKADAVLTGGGATLYQRLSGTSMAAAMVSGAAALVLQANPALKPYQVKAVLQLTSQRVPGAGAAEGRRGRNQRRVGSVGCPTRFSESAIHGDRRRVDRPQRPDLRRQGRREDAGVG